MLDDSSNNSTAAITKLEIIFIFEYYIYPMIIVIGLVLNPINVIVFAHQDITSFKSEFFRYLYIKSILDTIYSLFESIYQVFLRTIIHRDLEYDIYYGIHLYIREFTKSSSTFFEIVAAFDRLISFNRNSFACFYTKACPRIIILVILSVNAITHTYHIARVVVDILERPPDRLDFFHHEAANNHSVTVLNSTSTTLFEDVNEEWFLDFISQSPSQKKQQSYNYIESVATSVNFVDYIMTTVILIMINIILCYKIRKYINNKMALQKSKSMTSAQSSTLEGNNKSSPSSPSSNQQHTVDVIQNTIKMVVWICVIDILGHVMYIITETSVQNVDSQLMYYFAFFSVFHALSNSTNFFFYYFYNYAFRRCVKKTCLEMLVKLRLRRSAPLSREAIGGGSRRPRAMSEYNQQELRELRTGNTGIGGGAAPALAGIAENDET